MNRLTVLTPFTLGDSIATTGDVCAVAALEPGQWAAIWLNPAGEIMGSVNNISENKWTVPARLLEESVPGGFVALELAGNRATGWLLSARGREGAPAITAQWFKPTWAGVWKTQALPNVESSLQALTDGTDMAACKQQGIFSFRKGRRMVGQKPQFPSAGLVISRMDSEKPLDVAFSDEAPDANIHCVAPGVGDGTVCVAYVLEDPSGKWTVRAVVMSINQEKLYGSTWHRNPDYPRKPGVAGPMVGAHAGVIISAGGTSFSEGIKQWHDDIFALVPGEKSWRRAGVLPAPRAYGAAVSLPDGVLLMGGDTGSIRDSLCADVSLMTWDGAQVLLERMPALPIPLTNPMAVSVGGVVYCAGGNSGSPLVSGTGFWFLELDDLGAGWRALPTWPGPSRSHGVMAALNGAIFLFSGLETHVDAHGVAQSTYLRDAYKFHIGRCSWEKLPDLPWSAVAAPSPAPVTTSPERIFVLGGVDGRQAGHLPPETRVPDDIIYFDVAAHGWRLWPERWPAAAVTIPAVALGSQWHFVSGETMSRVRMTEVWAWEIDACSEKSLRAQSGRPECTAHRDQPRAPSCQSP